MSARKISHRQAKAVLALLTGNVTEAARAAGVVERTLYRWLKDDNFLEALATAESVALAQVAREMAGSASLAVKALVDVLEDSEATHSEKIKASRAYLFTLPNIRLLASIESRLAKLLEDSE